MTVDLSLAEAHDLAVRALTAAGATEANADAIDGVGDSSTTTKDTFNANYDEMIGKANELTDALNENIQASPTGLVGVAIHAELTREAFVSAYDDMRESTEDVSEGMIDLIALMQAIKGTAQTTATSLVRDLALLTGEGPVPAHLGLGSGSFEGDTRTDLLKLAFAKEDEFGAIEALRGILPDAEVDALIAMLERKYAILVAEVISNAAQAAQEAQDAVTSELEAIIQAATDETRLAGLEGIERTLEELRIRERDELAAISDLEAQNPAKFAEAVAAIKAKFDALTANALADEAQQQANLAAQEADRLAREKESRLASLSRLLEEIDSRSDKEIARLTRFSSAGEFFDAAVKSVERRRNTQLDAVLTEAGDLLSPADEPLVDLRIDAINIGVGTTEDDVATAVSNANGVVPVFIELPDDLEGELFGVEASSETFA